MKKILITGAAGFIGRHLSQGLSRKGYKALLFDVRDDFSPREGEFIKGDITDLKQVTRVCSRVEGVIHLAAVSRVSLARQVPYACLSANIMGTANILEGIRLAKARPWLIMASTREVSATWDNGRAKGDFSRISNLYGVSKFMGELLCSQYSKDFDLRVLVLRFADVYGSSFDGPQKILPRIIRWSLNNSPIKIEEPERQFDFIYYADLIRGINLAVRYMEKADYPIFRQVMLCNGRPISLVKLAKLIIKLTRSSSALECKTAAGRITKSRLYLDSKSANEALGFKAKVTLLEGLSRTIAQLRDGP